MWYREKMRHAESIVKAAKIRHDGAIRLYQNKLSDTNRKIDLLSARHKRVHSEVLIKFASTVARFKGVKLGDLIVDQSAVGEIYFQNSDAVSVVPHDVSEGETVAALGIGLGLPTTVAAAGMGGTFVAVTGTSFLGVLAGVAVPVVGLVVLAEGVRQLFKLGEKAEEALTRACEYAEEVDVEIESIKTATAYLMAADKRVAEVVSVSKRLESRLKMTTKKVSRMARNSKVRASRWLNGLGGVIAVMYSYSFNDVIGGVFLVFLFVALHMIVQERCKKVELTEGGKKLIYQGFLLARALKSLSAIKVNEVGEFDEDSSDVMRAATSNLLLEGVK